MMMTTITMMRPMRRGPGPGHSVYVTAGVGGLG